MVEQMPARCVSAPSVVLFPVALPLSSPLRTSVSSAVKKIFPPGVWLARIAQRYPATPSEIAHPHFASAIEDSEKRPVEIRPALLLRFSC